MELKFNNAAAINAYTAASRIVSETSQVPEDAVQPNARLDQMSLSKQAMDYLQGNEDAPDQAVQAAGKPMSAAEKKQQEKLEQVKSIQQMLESVRQQSEQMRKQSEQQSKALKEAMETMKRCGKIAKNISKGLKVPPKDVQYLIETDPNQYMMAMALRMMEEEKNKKAKSELKDKEDQESQENGAEEPVGGVDAASGEIMTDISADGGEVAVEGGAMVE